MAENAMPMPNNMPIAQMLSEGHSEYGGDDAVNQHQATSRSLAGGRGG